MSLRSGLLTVKKIQFDAPTWTRFLKFQNELKSFIFMNQYIHEIKYSCRKKVQGSRNDKTHYYLEQAIRKLSSYPLYCMEVQKEVPERKDNFGDSIWIVFFYPLSDFSYRLMMSAEIIFNNTNVTSTRNISVVICNER